MTRKRAALKFAFTNETGSHPAFFPEKCLRLFSILWFTPTRSTKKVHMITIAIFVSLFVQLITSVVNILSNMLIQILHCGYFAICRLILRCLLYSQLTLNGIRLFLP
jgi:heme A synthase